jgi:Tfp pilus assembly protein PilX
MVFQRPRWSTHKKEKGVVLPIALIMLVIISFAGLLAARNSASYEQFSNNMRTNQVARQSAEAALRYCERVAIDQVENEGVNYAADAGKIVSTTLTSDANISDGEWNKKASWDDAAANLIEVTLDPGSNVSDAAKSRYATNSPTCIIQPLINDRFLITARGLSNDASVDSDGLLESGSEVWLQSILTSSVPIKSASGGNE